MKKTSVPTGFATVKKAKANRFGVAPTPDEAGNNLEQPEHAPAAPGGSSPTKRAKALEKQKAPLRNSAFGFRVTAEFKREFSVVAAEDDLKHVELLERAFDLYKQQRKNR